MIVLPCNFVQLDDLEILYSKAVDLPIHLEESEQLNLKLSAVKVYNFSGYFGFCARLIFTKLDACRVIKFYYLVVIFD